MEVNTPAAIPNTCGSMQKVTAKRVKGLFGYQWFDFTIRDYRSRKPGGFIMEEAAKRPGK